MVDSEVRRIVNSFVRNLIKEEIKVEKVLLYGSYASGLFHENSDVDLAIISSDFGKNKFEEGKLLLRIAWRIDPRLNPIPVSTEAFEKDTWVPLINEIRQKGIELERTWAAA
ncbi:MAG: nucleotidyltransferase domain-containing protein [Thermodesulfobacteriota bacterium]|nr:nucleotidyltransferase domain-containing protein [Thermodesulfobacteriota bacterium]